MMKSFVQVTLCGSWGEVFRRALNRVESRPVRAAMSDCCPGLSRACVMLLMIVGFGMRAWAVPVEVTFSHDPNPRPGPLKGIEVRADSRGTFSWDMIRVGDVMTGLDQFDWTGVEQRLEGAANRGRHSILRPVLNVWDQRNPIPAFLKAIPGATHTNHTGVVFPVHSHPATRKALVDFVEAFGRRYDGDPRIGFIEMGMLGQWGEGWFPRLRSEVSLEVTPEARQEVFDAYQRSFLKTRLLMPGTREAARAPEFGFHNDAFAFWKRPGLLDRSLAEGIAADRWQIAPVIGRVHPEFERPDQVRNISTGLVTPERIREWIERDHLSCLRFNDSGAVPNPYREWFISGAARAGYDLHLTRARWDSTAAGFHLRIALTNSGVAPFYYRWPIEVAWATDRTIRQTWSIDGDIRTVIPGMGELIFEQIASLDFRPEPGALLLMRILNPLSKGPPIPLSNPTQDTDLAGWLTLGTTVL